VDAMAVGGCDKRGGEQCESGNGVCCVSSIIEYFN
jgi:hypothetical protein